ncbi:11-beta-hydroxysteroid dehydrogenase A-like [Typha angustifolia]|uniref:11-beta-hydroxysteroid dehydrogenase A-like n=1 Tax=Typha angustifolia TaxID=59011 RepID=UPI003C2ECD8A
MELIHTFMNVVAQPIMLTSLLLFLPPFYFFKLFYSSLASFFPEDMTHKVVLITGASSGIGEYLAYEYAKRGAFLVLVARRERSLHEVAERARELGSPDVVVVPADVAKHDECRIFVDVAITNFGRLDHLVNNAGIESLCLFEEVNDITNFRAMMDVNFWGSVYPTHFAIPHLKKTGGRIVGITSIAGYNFIPRMSFYSASKGALLNFYETIRVELGREVGVTIVVPGVIESEMSKGKVFSREGRMKVDQDLRDVVLSTVPVERTEDCAKAIVKGACRGAWYVIEPPWFISLYFFRVFMPEIVGWSMRLLYMTLPGVPAATSALTKKLLDLSALKDLLYPSSIQSPEIKAG